MNRKTLLKLINSNLLPVEAKSEAQAIKIFKKGGTVSNLSDFSNSYDVMSYAVSRDGRNLRLCSDRLKDNESIVTAAVRNYGEAILYANERYRKIESVVIDAFISSNGELSLNDVDSSFKKDLTVAFVAIMSNPRELFNVDTSLIHNKDFMSLVRDELSNRPKEEKDYQKVIGM